MVNAGKFGCSSDVEMGIWKYIKASGLVVTLEKNTFIVSNSASCLVLIAIGGPCTGNSSEGPGLDIQLFYFLLVCVIL